jgi:hypothetical protein
MHMHISGGSGVETMRSLSSAETMRSLSSAIGQLNCMQAAQVPPRPTSGILR